MTDLWDHFLGRIGLDFETLKENTPYTYMPKEEWKEYYVYKKDRSEDESAAGIPHAF